MRVGGDLFNCLKVILNRLGNDRNWFYKSLVSFFLINFEDNFALADFRLPDVS